MIVCMPRKPRAIHTPKMVCISLFMSATAMRCNTITNVARLAGTDKAGMSPKCGYSSVRRPDLAGQLPGF